MKGTYTLSRFAGIPLRVHWSFALIFLWFAYIGYDKGMDATGIIWSFIFIVILFICVVLHEYGHALVARRFNISTRDIILLPLGGLARLAGMPSNPTHELLIAIAGPLVNLAISFILCILIFIIPGISFFPDVNVDQLFGQSKDLIPIIFWLNIGLALFNMVPAFPMDGGRVLRASLSFFIPRVKATRIASLTGQIIALGFVLTGTFYTRPILALIGLFIFFTAGYEYRMIKNQQELLDKTASQLMMPDFSRLFVFDTIRVVMQKQFETGEKNFLVFDLDRGYKGMLSANAIIQAINQELYNAPVADFITPKKTFISPKTSAQEILQIFKDSSLPMLPVHSKGEIIGIIYRDQMRNYWSQGRRT